jgi:ribosomal protein S15P/S13E
VADKKKIDEEIAKLEAQCNDLKRRIKKNIHDSESIKGLRTLQRRINELERRKSGE